MGKKWVCEICGQEGELSSLQPAREGELPQPALSCSILGPSVVLAPTDISIFNVGAYSMKVCFACRERLSDGGLRNELRAKVSLSRSRNKQVRLRNAQ